MLHSCDWIPFPGNVQAQSWAKTRNLPGVAAGDESAGAERFPPTTAVPLVMQEPGSLLEADAISCCQSRQPEQRHAIHFGCQGNIRYGARLDLNFGRK